VQPLHEQAIKNLITSGLFKPEQLQKFDLPEQFDPTKAEAGMRQVLGAKDRSRNIGRRRSSARPSATTRTA
jgi:hypothetical protein